MATVVIPPADELKLPVSLERLTILVDDRPQNFAQGDEDIRDAGLAAAKFIFDVALRSEAKGFPHVDELIQSLEAPSQTDTITTRSGSKRKRNDIEKAAAPPPSTEPTPLGELFTNGMDEDQIWEQLELRAKRVCRMAESILESEEVEEGSAGEEDKDGGQKRRRVVMNGDKFDDFDMDEEIKGFDFEDGDEGEEGASGESEEDDIAYGQEREEDLRDSEDTEPELEDLDASLDGLLQSKKKPKRGHPSLDDDFFSIDDFNRETEAMESRSRSRGHLGDDTDDDMEADDDIDLFEAIPDDPGDEAEPLYTDFFARPSRGVAGPKSSENTNGSGDRSSPGKPGKPGVRFQESVRVKTIKPNRKLSLDLDLDKYPFSLDDIDGDIEGLDLEDEDSNDEDEDEDAVGDDDYDEDEEEGGESDDLEDRDEIMDRTKDDLFANDEELETSNLSSHQKRLAALAAEIEELEAENVGAKPWTLMGEAGARGRPLNSLLEEDLEFEHAVKQVPIVTEETTKGLEERIKQRILDNNFNDVVRKRPVDDKSFLPSRFFELQDTRSQKSLAQIYEDNYTAARTGDTAIVDDRDGKLKQEHDEIEKAWEEISYKLDALSNAHFTPKAPKATISTMSNLPVVSLESALPTVMSTATLMAPEEVYSSTPGELRARSEMTPGEKKSARRKGKQMRKKEKERLEAAVGMYGRKGKQSAKKEKEEALKKVVKVGRGVTVVGKKSKDKDKALPLAANLKL